MAVDLGKASTIFYHCLTYTRPTDIYEAYAADILCFQRITARFSHHTDFRSLQDNYNYIKQQ